MGGPFPQVEVRCRRWRATAVWLWLGSVLFALLGLVAAPASARSGPQASLTPADWAQFQGSASHLGASPSGTPAPPLRRLWTFHEPNGLVGLSGAVGVGGTAIAVGDHGVYGLDAASGATRWSIARSAGSPIAMPAVGQSGRREVLVYTDGAKDGDSTIVGVDLADHQELWRRPLRAVSRSGVTIDGSLVVVGDREAHLYGFDLATGKPTSWSPVSLGGGAIEAPPAASGGQVYVTTENNTTGDVKVVAVKESDGGQTWDYTPRFAAGTGTPVTIEDGRASFALGSEQEVHALTRGTGVAAWTSRTRSSFSPLVAPASATGTLYVLSTSATDSALYAFDTSDGTKRWDFQFEVAGLLSSPVVAGDTVYVGLDDGRVVGIDVRRGVEVWEDRTGAGAIGQLSASGDELIASKRGRRGGLVAFGSNPGGHLLDIQSPSTLRLGHVLADYAIAFAAVIVIVFGAVRSGRRLLAEPGLADSGGTSASTDDEPEPPDEPEGDP